MSGRTARLAVFDCDGTLVDGQAAVCNAAEAAFASLGLPPPPRGDVRRIVGLSLPVAMRKLAPEAPPDVQSQLVDAYRQQFFRARSEGRVHEPLFDGVSDLLTRLRSRGWELGVATGKSDRGLQNCLFSHGILDMFCTLQTADRHPSKPHPAMLEAAIADAGVSTQDAVIIGDTAYDMEMGRAIGVRALGVAWGYHEAPELKAAGAEAVARDPAHLEQLLA